MEMRFQNYKFQQNRTLSSTPAKRLEFGEKEEKVEKWYLPNLNHFREKLKIIYY